MSITSHLNINEIGENQNNKYITMNNAIGALAAAGQAVFEELSVGAGPVELTDAEASRYMVYKFAGGSANFDVEFPSVIGLNNVQRTFAVANLDTTYTLTVKASTGAGDIVVLAPNETALISQNYEDMTLISSGVAGAAARPYDIAVFVPGVTTDAQLIARVTILRAFKFADDFAGSDGNTGTNPTSAATFTFKKNGSTIGTLTFNTSGAPTFLTSGSGDETFAAGDILAIESQATADATMADISISLLGVRL